MPRMSGLTPPRRVMHKVFHFISTTVICFIVPEFIRADLCFFVSRDCPIFYRRKKAQKDMAEAKMQLDRWNF